MQTMFENIGGGELLLILFVILIFFGPKKIPEIGQSIGKGIREFRKSIREVQENLDIDPKDPLSMKSKDQK
ncbi:MAG: twin-arginine translocase TatA/TatE family subunit [Ignavibacteriales bacterium CG07_land_8_20_14_0_80_59_12]|nr:MAG: twin-arginine translocase TatA/TatE family subunit [Ignavibacteriales bacterium CG07_land_8_20_14_0_80_59_12]